MLTVGSLFSGIGGLDLGFVIGAVLGASLGLLMAGLCVMARKGEQR